MVISTISTLSMIYLINLLTANADVVATSCKLSGSYLHPPEVCRVLFYSAFKFTERGHLNTIHSNLLKCTKDIKVYLLFIENILSAKIIFSRYFREEKNIQIAYKLQTAARARDIRDTCDVAVSRVTCGVTAVGAASSRIRQ